MTVARTPSRWSRALHRAASFGPALSLVVPTLLVAVNASHGSYDVYGLEPAYPRVVPWAGPLVGRLVAAALFCATLVLAWRALTARRPEGTRRLATSQIGCLVPLLALLPVGFTATWIVGVATLLAHRGVVLDALFIGALTAGVGLTVSWKLVLGLGRTVDLDPVRRELIIAQGIPFPYRIRRVRSAEVRGVRVDRRYRNMVVERCVKVALAEETILVFVTRDKAHAEAVAQEIERVMSSRLAPDALAEAARRRVERGLVNEDGAAVAPTPPREP